MSPLHAALCATLLVSTAGVTTAATMPSDKEKMRARAEHGCYDDVRKLCSDVTSDEK